MSKKRKRSKIAPRTNAEWVSLVISLFLLAVVVGIVIKLWVSETQETCPVQNRDRRGAQRSGAVYLPFTLTNEGDQTAAEVTVEGRIECRGQRGDYLQLHSTSYRATRGKKACSFSAATRPRPVARGKFSAARCASALIGILKMSSSMTRVDFDLLYRSQLHGLTSLHAPRMNGR